MPRRSTPLPRELVGEPPERAPGEAVPASDVERFIAAALAELDWRLTAELDAITARSRALRRGRGG